MQYYPNYKYTVYKLHRCKITELRHTILPAYTSSDRWVTQYLKVNSMNASLPVTVMTSPLKLTWQQY